MPAQLTMATTTDQQTVALRVTLIRDVRERQPNGDSSCVHEGRWGRVADHYRLLCAEADPTKGSAPPGKKALCLAGCEGL